MNNDDQHGGGGNNGDWFDNHAPPAPGGGAFDDNAVREAYKKYLGREPNAQELAAHRGNPGGSGAVVTLIQNSPEAKDYLARTGAGAGGGEGPQNGNFQAWFNTLTQGKAPTPAMLTSLEPLLNKYGVTLAPNRTNPNMPGKIKLPNGMIIDVIQGAEGGGKAWQWLTPDQAGSGSGAAPNPQMAPAPGPYTSAPWTGGTYAPPPLPTELQTPFTAPTQAELEASPGYATRLAAGRQTLERSAAARGTISNGGTMKALERYAQDYGSNEYNSLYGQKMGARNQNYAEYQGAVNVGNQTYQNRYGAWQTENNRTRGDYTLNTDTRRNWENDYWGRLRDVYRGGLDAAL